MAEEQATLQGMLGNRDPMDGPIPGESLTADPEMKAPFEKAPEHTNQRAAIDDIFMRITDPAKIDQSLDLMRDGVPLESLAQVLLFEGFRQGKFNPDMMLMLIEPTIYMLAFVANTAGIDAELYPEGKEDPDFISEEEESSFLQGALEDEEPVTEGESIDQIKVGAVTLKRPESISPGLLDQLKQKESSDG